jgi:hypothetical protein
MALIPEPGIILKIRQPAGFSEPYITCRKGEPGNRFYALSFSQLNNREILQDHLSPPDLPSLMIKRQEYFLMV